MAFDGHIKTWADGLSFANAFSHPHVHLRNVERKSRRDRGWNPAMALRYRETEGALAIVPADPSQATYTQVSEFTWRLVLTAVISKSGSARKAGMSASRPQPLRTFAPMMPTRILTAC